MQRQRPARVSSPAARPGKRQVESRPLEDCSVRQRRRQPGLRQALETGCAAIRYDARRKLDPRQFLIGSRGRALLQINEGNQSRKNSSQSRGKGHLQTSQLLQGL